MEKIMTLIRKLLDRFTKKKEAKQAIPEAPPPKLQIRTVQDVRTLTQIRTFQDVRAFCGEVRKTLTIYKNSCEKMLDISWTHKKAIDSLYVEMGNLSDKIDRLCIEKETKL